MSVLDAGWMMFMVLPNYSVRMPDDGIPTFVLVLCLHPRHRHGDDGVIHQPFGGTLALDRLADR